MAAPPLLAGGLKLMVAELPAAAMEVMVGAPGAVAGATGVPLADPVGPLPAVLVALTEQR